MKYDKNRKNRINILNQQLSNTRKIANAIYNIQQTTQFFRTMQDNAFQEWLAQESQIAKLLDNYSHEYQKLQIREDFKEFHQLLYNYMDTYFQLSNLEAINKGHKEIASKLREKLHEDEIALKDFLFNNIFYVDFIKKHFSSDLINAANQWKNSKTGHEKYLELKENQLEAFKELRKLYVEIETPRTFGITDDPTKYIKVSEDKLRELQKNISNDDILKGKHHPPGAADIVGIENQMREYEGQLRNELSRIEKLKNFLEATHAIQQFKGDEKSSEIFEQLKSTSTLTTRCKDELTSLLQNHEKRVLLLSLEKYIYEYPWEVGPQRNKHTIQLENAQGASSENTDKRIPKNVSKQLKIINQARQGAITWIQAYDEVFKIGIDARNESKLSTFFRKNSSTAYYNLFRVDNRGNLLDSELKSVLGVGEKKINPTI